MYVKNSAGGADGSRPVCWSPADAQPGLRPDHTPKSTS